ncbi:hypothetical protein LXT12_12990 [Pelomonas sp. P7]|uniref:Capsule polysaccharide biosynthesis protein n=1 Tax=Pelomonas caseinilytica TaxID=2906763 RepID=A0ABS8XGS0_9BURK|nr:hypothetical protein [Pelomonas sp. P7]MCE4538167.1 hypothetical protein [Pelomonas sp. P7]
MSSEAGKSPALSALYAAERRHGWFDFRLDGWAVWRVLRTPVYNVAAALPLSYTRESRKSQLKRSLKATAGVLGYLLIGRHCDVLVKSFRSALRSRHGDRFRDVYFDGVLDQQPSHFKLEVVNTTAFTRQAAQAFRPANADAYAFTFWGAVLGRLFPCREAEVFCRDLAGSLQSEVGIEIGERFLLQRLSAMYWESRLYALLLARLRTRLVMVADTSEYALRRACSMRGIPFVEMQHGVFDEDHPDAVPAWVSGSAAELLLPDALACYGPYWVARLAASRQYGVAQPVGNELVDYYRVRRLSRQVDEANTQVHLLFTSQGIDTERAVAWLDTLLKSAPPNLRTTLTVKLHPAYDNDAAPYAGLVALHGAVLVAGSQEPNVWELLTEADLHLSISSACHFDAAALGVPSVVMPLQGHYLMEAAINGRSIFSAQTPKAVWTLLASLRGFTAADMGEYASPGFTQRIDQLINRLCAASEQAQSSSAGELQ